MQKAKVVSEVTIVIGASSLSKNMGAMPYLVRLLQGATLPLTSFLQVQVNVDCSFRRLPRAPSVKKFTFGRKWDEDAIHLYAFSA